MILIRGSSNIACIEWWSWGLRNVNSLRDNPSVMNIAICRHHDHMVCTKCGKIVEFANEQIERLQVEVAAGYGFHMLQHRMEIYGLCSDCYSKRNPLMPLIMAKPGEKVVVREVAGCRHKQARLTSMGLRPGDRVEIINNTGGGRVILGLENTRLAIGRGMANKIMVSLSENTSKA